MLGRSCRFVRALSGSYCSMMEVIENIIIDNVERQREGEIACRANVRGLEKRMEEVDKEEQKEREPIESGSRE